MANEIYFFTTKIDLIRIIHNVEQNIKLKYIETNFYDSGEIKVFHLLEEYENFGINLSGDHQSESFLVLERNDLLNIREVKQTNGGVKYYVDQMNNKNSIVIWPGGIYKDQYLICGHAGTINKTPESKNLLNIFKKNIKNECNVKIGRYFIGNDAMKLFKQMRFITINVNQSKEYDVNLGQQK